MRSFPYRLSLVALYILTWFLFGNAKCPIVNPEHVIMTHVVVIDQVPVKLSAALCFNTTITIFGRTIPVTNAPTVLSSTFMVESTVTYIETRNPSLTVNNGFSTTTQVLSNGLTTPSINIPPQHASEIGKKIKIQSLLTCRDRQRTSLALSTYAGSSIPENKDINRTLPGQDSFDLLPTETYPIDRQRVLTQSETVPTVQTPSSASVTTLTGLWAGTVPSTIAILPTGSDSVGIRLVLQPMTREGANSPRPFASLFIEITASWTGSATATYTVSPIESDAPATRLVLSPANSVSSDVNEGNGPLFDDEFALLAPPSNEEDSLLLFNQTPPNTSSAGPDIVPDTLFPQLPEDQIFTGPFAGTSATGSALLPSDMTVFPPRPSAIGSGIVILPSDDTLPNGLPLDVPRTTLNLPWTGSMMETIDVPPAAADRTGTRLLLNPAAQPRLFTGPLITVTARGPGMFPTTMTVPPTDPDITGTLIVLRPENTEVTQGPISTSRLANPVFTNTELFSPDARPNDAVQNEPNDFIVLAESAAAASEAPPAGGPFTTPIISFAIGGSVSFPTTSVLNRSGEQALIDAPSVIESALATSIPTIAPALITSNNANSLDPSINPTTGSSVPVQSAVGVVGTTTPLLQDPAGINIQLSSSAPASSRENPLDNLISLFSSPVVVLTTAISPVPIFNTTITDPISFLLSSTTARTLPTVSPEPQMLTSATNSESADVSPTPSTATSLESSTSSLRSSNGGAVTRSLTRSIPPVSIIPSTISTSNMRVFDELAAFTSIRIPSQTQLSTGLTTPTVTSLSSVDSISSLGNPSVSSPTSENTDDSFTNSISLTSDRSIGPTDLSTLLTTRNAGSSIFPNTESSRTDTVSSSASQSAVLSQTTSPGVQSSSLSTDLTRQSGSSSTSLSITSIGLSTLPTSTPSGSRIATSSLTLNNLSFSPSSTSSLSGSTSANLPLSSTASTGTSAPAISSLRMSSSEMFSVRMTSPVATEPASSTFVDSSVLRKTSSASNTSSSSVITDVIMASSSLSTIFTTDTGSGPSNTPRTSTSASSRSLSNPSSVIFKVSSTSPTTSAIRTTISSIASSITSSSSSSSSPPQSASASSQSSASSPATFILRPSTLLPSVSSVESTAPSRITSSTSSTRSFTSLSSSISSTLSSSTSLTSPSATLSSSSSSVISSAVTTIRVSTLPTSSATSVLTTSSPSVVVSTTLRSSTASPSSPSSSPTAASPSSSTPNSSTATFGTTSTQQSPSASSITAPAPATSSLRPSLTTTSSSRTFTGCIITATAIATPTCIVTLPGACASLPTTDGLVPLIPVVAACALDLGVFSVGSVAACLAFNLDLNPRGQPIADCLLRALRASCPQSLPTACVDLQISNGLALLADLPACAAALGPYGVGGTACLALNSITSLTTGASIFQCLQDNFRLQPQVTTVTNPALCPTA